ncbi:SixA phosphatase family protein [Plebeiibacterium marinum]|uniref:Histidine phosphatase family protein n=1 Tax=Plebeiibacterium marinum TaxID=2992111 RepID=A0AAE3MDM2_9BACT|nr:histidine phosphatase family protein [Plebeiobacterium marinum]MCW3805604.1 histidine phosphatase family protein [Plebeiobacterium marinum]
MKKLILVRHAKTEQLYDYSKSDFDRKLLPRGHKDAATIANQLKNKEIIPDLFITSKAKRAKQTAEIYAETLGYNPSAIKKEQFIYDGYTTSEMIKYLSQFNSGSDTIIIFGHNPDIAGFTVNLISDDLWHFPTSCTTVINFNIDSWKDIEVRSGKVELYIYPKMFK